MNNPFTEKMIALELELKEQRENSPNGGSPYTVGLASRLGGMREVLSHPLYVNAREVLEATIAFHAWFKEFDSAVYHEINCPELKALLAAIAKATGDDHHIVWRSEDEKAGK